jgi:hypothetical protein
MLLVHEMIRYVLNSKETLEYLARQNNMYGEYCPDQIFELPIPTYKSIDDVIDYAIDIVKYFEPKDVFKDNEHVRRLATLMTIYCEIYNVTMVYDCYHKNTTRLHLEDITSKDTFEELRGFMNGCTVSAKYRKTHQSIYDLETLNMSLPLDVDKANYVRENVFRENNFT